MFKVLIASQFVAFALVVFKCSFVFSDISWSTENNACTYKNSSRLICEISNVTYTEASIFLKKENYTGDDFAYTYTTIGITNSTLFYIPQNLFNFFSRAKVFRILKTGLLEINQNDFKNGAGLQTIQITGNTVQKLNDQLFLNAPHVKVLDLSSNGIEFIQSKSFHGLGKLKVLNLRNNNVRQLWAGTFQPLVKLSELYLSFNQIYFIDNNVFPHHVVDSLQLNSNRLRRLESDKIPRTVMLNLSDNFLSEIEWSNLITKKAWLSDNQLKYINATSSTEFICLCNNSKPLNLTFANTSSIQTLLLRNSQLISVDFIKSIPRIKDLDLSYNNLQNSDLLRFNKDMKWMSTLHLHGNNISEIPVDNFRQHFPQYFRLGLSANAWNCSYLEQTQNAFKMCLIKVLAENPCLEGDGCVNGISCTGPMLPRNKTQIELIQDSIIDLQNEIENIKKVHKKIPKSN